MLVIDNFPAKCEVINYITRLEVISNLWRCAKSLVIKMDKNLVNESKIKKIFFRYFKTKLSRPSEQWILFSILLIL